MQQAQDCNTSNHESGLDYDQDNDNLVPQKTYENKYQQRPQTQLEHFIMEKISSEDRQQDLISKDLEVKLEKLVQSILFSNADYEQKLKMRMHELALSKILVHTHGKSEFYLVKAHHHLGQAYLNYKCYEQALDHLTISLKKNAKINDMSEIKLYHSYVLTTYSRCYYEISSYDDALQILRKAYDIQLGCEDAQHPIDNNQTLKLISNCYLKQKDHQKSLQFIDKALSLIETKKGRTTKQYSKTKIQKSKILVHQQLYPQSIKELDQAIDILHEIKYDDKLEIADCYELLSTYYEKNHQQEKQIQILRKKYQLLSQRYEEGHQKALKVKRVIAGLLHKSMHINEAIKEYEEILEFQEKYYSENKLQIGKTLKVLGTCKMINDDKLNQAQHYFKKAQKLLSDCGVPKLVKQIKQKLQLIKQKKESKSANNMQLGDLQKEIQKQPMGVAH